jgi:outer membrane protein assembly factor BamE (lipoprotein component of BamABCDE complex)
MVDSLIRSRTLDGLSRSQVSALLGQPSSGEYFRDWDIVYRLGDERGLFRIDSEWLVIRFDRTGRVSEYRIQRD